jgi:hypothetical protein
MLRDVSTALRLLILMTIGGWVGFQYIGEWLLLQLHGTDRGVGEGDRFDIYGTLIGMMMALCIHLGWAWRAPDLQRRRFAKRCLLAIAATVLVAAIYAGGYVSTGWLAGRGIMSQQLNSRLNRTVYYPITACRRLNIGVAIDLERLRTRADQIGFASAQHDSTRNRMRSRVEVD